MTYFNCALLFAWNRQVIGADDKVEKLRTAIRARFYSRIALTTTNVYLDSVESRDGLVDTIKDALAKAQARIMANPRFFRPAVAAPGLEPPVSGSFTISNML